MRFFDRFINLAKADAHGVLDSLEDPGLVLKQCLRAAEGELLSNQERRDELSRWLDELVRQRVALGSRIEDLDEEIRLAIAEDAEELARFSIRRLLATRRKGEEIDNEIRVAEQERDELAVRTASQEAELEELRTAVEAHLARERAAAAGCLSSDSDRDIGGAVRAEEIELELLRRRRAEVGGEAIR